MISPTEGHTMKIGVVKATAERAAKTFLQTLAALALGDGVFDLFSFDWGPALGMSASAAVLSVLSSLASTTVGNAGPSLANETVVPDAPAGVQGL